jgi:hypothetical protein
MVHAFMHSTTSDSYCRGQHDFEFFAAVAPVCFQLKKSKLRLTAYAMLRQPHLWEICTMYPYFGAFRRENQPDALSSLIRKSSR